MRKADIRFTVILEKEAIDLYLWSLKEDGMPLPKRDLEFETIRIAA